MYVANAIIRVLSVLENFGMNVLNVVRAFI
jgi:hypothetical protein